MSWIMSEPNLNEYIKELFQSLDLDREVTITTERGQGIITEKKKLCEVYSSHDNVHTFCTRAIKKGVTPKSLSIVIGKDIKTIIDFYYGLSFEDFKSDIVKTF